MIYLTAATTAMLKSPKTDLFFISGASCQLTATLLVCYFILFPTSIIILICQSKDGDCYPVADYSSKVKLERKEREFIYTTCKASRCLNDSKRRKNGEKEEEEDVFCTSFPVI